MLGLFNIKKYVLFVAILVSAFITSYSDILNAATRQNYYPIVLCHGNAGWGRSEMAGYKYWGGFNDLQQTLINYGYTTYTVAVGPFSSNWDRACEMYAQIKGGTVDYGKAHSTKYGHARYGRTYPGLYTNWGTLTNGKINKIHIISHSQGGQNSRMLIQLLSTGSAEERAATPTGLSPLFAGSKNWVSSLTTLCTPHDGTSISDYNTDKLKELAKQFIAYAGAAAGLGDELIYDFKLDQWGLVRNSGESFVSYANRVWSSSVFNKSNKDFSFYDLGTDGAVVQNGWVKAKSDVYYFSYGAQASYADPITGYHLPTPIAMNPIFNAFSLILGSYTRNEAGRVIINSNWWPNDGVVNTISESGPKCGSTDVIVNYNGTPQIGKWNFMGNFSNTDHADVIGVDTVVDDLYRGMADNLGKLPVIN